MCFESFGRLPYELRLQIWEEAFDAAPGRLFHAKDRHDSEDGRASISFWDNRPSQSLAQVCHESRTVAERYGTTLFGHDCENSVRFRPQNDMLYFDSTYVRLSNGVWDLSSLKISPGGGLEKVEIVAIHAWCPSATWELIRTVRTLYRTFPGLKRIIYLTPHEYSASRKQGHVEEAWDCLRSTDVLVPLAGTDSVKLGHGIWTWQKAKEVLRSTVERVDKEGIIKATPQIQGLKKAPNSSGCTCMEGARDSHELSRAKDDNSVENIATADLLRSPMGLQQMLPLRHFASSSALLKAF